MRAQKIKVLITIEALSPFSIPGLIHDVKKDIDNGRVSGSFEQDDGDRAVWETITKPVEF